MKFKYAPDKMNGACSLATELLNAQTIIVHEVKSFSETEMIELEMISKAPVICFSLSHLWKR